MQALGGPSPGQTCVLILIFTVLLQSLCVAVTYMYFTRELKQMQDKYSQSGIACFLKEDDIPWDPNDEESMNNPCWQVKWQLRQFVRKMILKTYEETIPSIPEKQLNIPYVVNERGLQRVAAHITGTSRRRSTFPVPSSKNEKALGQKINSWESSRKGHSFLSNLHLRNGELVIHQSGFYYIYSQTYFRFQEPEETSGTISREQNRKKNKQMVQYIYKYTSYPDPILLMKSARNSCWSKDSEYGLYSIYQGGIFELKENDRIFVSVNNEQLIDMDQEASFFGAFLIG
ncbi:tumor necrosis factor ligand superfamily member 10 [Ursus americanus]|nr:tumor necrosis factor ligand superfamily member 10 isoform X3 [Ursus maritimus]XP_045644609.1 tumor necrosis factor ligand superfamily member 10 [Ursus americanus]XP_045644610.1 tumor necrosis factor ligand superfamily member 10 [Ursus americanus]XP_045644611.1 tumor necrosis factor ligand superfamily member 10 [Ursus americanus]